MIMRRMTMTITGKNYTPAALELIKKWFAHKGIEIRFVG